ncbi:putative soluble pyridine nucleotide transhydrogenase [Phytophthora fragariae]|uniref:NAD(P)(+) transhydrogenase (Si-specific) n=2 Tax=Phytophthora TaxID=4783 RepID=A0A6A3S1I4_9STRA|nr:putative soluble pyridine nucleotide transhydrogenase [Phytophthora fragariae]KAE9044774.1 putative soluble pyridine nucleotide transhydrogenase [Phytophthora rubi]KAE8926954.1 putative soluble pyridine nucleotide transhydrogenase [Phytophthora fragariae]KAE8983904.1 putative soluble pyridine nucleotide transhydrogenase [Phytophthora fragariae]KAE9050778.1 putative soluble pyridine nucleotide transhydrogenase [Phytophthora rubi]
MVGLWTTATRVRGGWAGRRLSTQALKPQVAAYDLVVIGSGPSATQCALESAKRGKKVAIVDKQTSLGGVCVHTGTIPSKTFREAVLHLSGYRHHGFYGKSYSMKTVTIEDILYRVQRVVSSEEDVVRAQLKAARVDVVPGFARFESEHEISIVRDEGSNTASSASSNVDALSRIKADKFLIACGTRPAHNPLVPIDGKVVIDSDQILSRDMHQLPRSLIVVGAGVIGMEYASMVNVVPGHSVTVVDGRPDILSFCDREIISNLTYEMQSNGARFLLGETVEKVETTDNRVKVFFESGKVLSADALLYTVGRQASTNGLNLEAVGLSRNHRGLINVNKNYQTDQPHIYAAGDCIGAPALASTSMEQGRLASCHMWNPDEELEVTSQLDNGNYPYGIYTIPEISMVGQTEQQLTKACVNYEVGIAKYSELAKGQMMGAMAGGTLKILFDPDTLKLFGVHAIGEGATEIIHIGQVAMAMGCSLTYFRDAVFNYPTLAEAYRVAALNGLGRLSRNAGEH